MATYKVLQDIEAEDKLLGPLTLRQFIFAAITIGIGFIQITLLISSAPMVLKLPFAIILLPFLLVFGFLSAPFSRDQPNDVWLIARLRFLFRPRVRIWNQDGIQELVTVTAPKHEERIFTDNLTQTEVKSRLGALASTLDSRGWAVKNVNTNLFTAPSYLTSNSGSDRLVDPSQLPQEVSIIEVQPSSDIFDSSNVRAQHLDQLVQQATSQHKQQVIAQMSQEVTKSEAPAPAPDYWFMNQTSEPQAVPPDFATFSKQQVIAPGAAVDTEAQATDEEKALIAKSSAATQEVTTHMKDRLKVLQPLHDRDGKITPRPPVDQQAHTEQDKTMPLNPTLQALSQDNNRSVATIAKEAKQATSHDDGEVVISLH